VISLEPIILSWEDLERHLSGLAFSLQYKQFDSIYGVKDGGFPIAVLLAQKLELRLTDSPGENTLVVDDVSRTGDTLSGYKKENCAVVFASPLQSLSGLMFAKMLKDKKQPVQFPYGKKENGSKNKINQNKKF
jgi:adenine/guanine phosphoribosyltransferase-like PRPP-binding protein